MLMKNAYVAFSIHGTNAFIVATKVVDVQNLPEGFKIVNSRDRTKTAEKDGYKLSWDRLMSKKGLPLRSPPVVLARFKELTAQGWKIDKSKFVGKHYVSQYKHAANNKAVSR